MNPIKFFSKGHRKLVESLISAIRKHYSDHLISLAIFGSYARGENRLNSDLDLLIVLDEGSFPGRLKANEEFVREIELPAERSLGPTEKTLRMEVSPLILTKKGAGHFLPLYLDMVQDRILIFDRDDFLKKILQKTQNKMEAWGSKKKSMGGHWYWEIRPGTRWGEVFDYD